MSWGLVFAGVSAASGLFNAIDESHANRRIIADLNEIKNYLKDLKKTLRLVQQQNEEILNKLNELPEQIRQIVDEIVSTSLLEERYSYINDVWENFLVLRRWRRVGIRSDEWRRYSDAMNYIFDHENRVSKLFNLISICEFALCITRGRTKSLVILRLDQKSETIKLLSDDYETKINSLLDKLKIDLDNTNYIVSHNLSANLNDIENLTFQQHPNRLKTENYTERVCETRRSGGRLDRMYTVCRNEHRTRQVTDTAYNNARDNHVKSINSQIAFIKDQIKHFAELCAVYKTLVNYRQRISNKSLNEVFTEENSVYFTKDDQVALSNHPIDDSDFEAFLHFDNIIDGDDVELSITERESFNVI
ncbi:hypothetical protein [Flavobacterium sp. C4GT6]|uniref:hypothetical protein n=1 Tax=Flavobacterium sp. C4GT6 TaxID=3103818 RepID=UPI002ED41E1B